MIEPIILTRFLLAFTACVLMSCWQSKIPTTSQIAGNYVFVYPSGEAEVLLMMADSTYRNDIYSRDEDYKRNSPPTYSNTGKWSLVRPNELKFSDWLMYNEMRYPDKILAEPFRGTMTNVH